jgi:asparagine synthase (glutamine-hydrolysing)
MSVQAGVWNFDGQPVKRSDLRPVSDALAPYGPDGEAFHFDNNIGFLYRPFHTTKESRSEIQPYRFQGGKVITWDGRLDNRDELIVQLRGILQSNPTDVATVAAAVEVWGTDGFAKLTGDWALAIWDPKAKELLLARDYIGVKQLFYYPTPKQISWCNHLAPLALCGDHFTLCDEYVAGCLASAPDAHLTPFAEVHSVPPGKFIRVAHERLSIHTYWSFNPRLKTRFATDAEYEERYRFLFRQAVRRRLRTDSPVLADLSGGFDSSSIVCMADDILAENPVHDVDLDTFSFYDSHDPKEEGDWRHIRVVEEKRHKAGFHTDLKASTGAFPFDAPVFLANPRFANRPDFRIALHSILQGRPHRVLLCGEGGDEFNGQALDPRVQLADLLLQGHLAKFGKQLTAWSLLIRKRPLIQLLLQTLLQLTPASIRARLTEQGQIEPWVNQQFARKHGMAVRQIGTAEGTCFGRPSARDAGTTIAGLSRLMSCTGPSQVEKRYPYLDQNLVEFLTSIPLDQLLRPGQRRSLMRRSLAGLLPEEILVRKSKATFGSGFLRSLEKHWNSVETMWHSPLSGHLGYVDTRQTFAALVSMRHGNCPPFMTRLLNVICLEIWLRDADARGILRLRLGTRAFMNNGSQIGSQRPVGEKPCQIHGFGA